MSRPDKENPKDRLEQTARELRKHRPRPSAALVARVEQIAESRAERRSRPVRPRLSRRRLVFALAATLALAAGGAIVADELGQSPKTAASGTAKRNTVVHLGALSKTLAQENDADQYKQRAPLPLSPSTPARLQDLNTAAGSTSSDFSRQESVKNPAASITTGNRLAELYATLVLKVENRDQLSERTAQAMKIARSLSGYVVSTRMNAPSRGVATSYLVLKVPAKRSQEALIRISELGMILSQQVSLEDVKATVTSQGNAIQALKREIASLEKTLKEQTLTAQARSQLEIKLANDRARLNSLRVQRNQEILRGRLATIELTLTTGELPKPVTNPSRIHKAVDRAWNGLSAEISWAAMAIIVASPFLVAGIALLALLRGRRRREERRLLEK
jgi:hypothetical protein